jgi:hypothetical protein
MCIHGTGCGCQSPHEMHRLRAENERLRAALNEYADHADDSGWRNLAAEIRRRAADVSPSSSDPREGA